MMFAQLAIGVLGVLLRNTAAGISTFVAVFSVIPPLTDLLPSSWSSHFAQYLPANAGEMLFGGARGLAHPLAPWAGFGVLCAYAAVMIGCAAWRLRRVAAAPRRRLTDETFSGVNAFPLFGYPPALSALVEVRCSG